MGKLTLDNLREILYDLQRRNMENKTMRVTMSELAKCLRQSYYYSKYPDTEINDKIVMGWENHNWLQEHLSDELEKRGYKCTSEAELYYYDLKGKADLYCRSDDEKILFEFKFTSNATATNVLLPWYRRQLKYYLAALDYLGDKNVRGILLLSTFNLQIYYLEEIVLSEDEMKKVKEEMDMRYEYLLNAKKLNIEPEREKGPWCNICRFRQICYSDRLL